MKSLLIILLLSFFITGCSKKEDLKDQLTSQNFSIYYSKQNGMLPWKYEADFSSYGRLKIKETNNTSESERKATYELTPAELDSLKNYIQNLSNVKLQNYGFGDDKPFDLPVTQFKYKLDSYTDSSSIYLPGKNEMPEQLSVTIDKIVSILRKYDKIY